MNRWLLKTEPETYGWSTLVAAGRGTWDGVRNPRARAYLGRMQPGDEAFFYHTGKSKAVVGVVRVVSQPFPDPTDADGHFLAVEVEPVRELARPVTLAEVKASPLFADMTLVTAARLSVQKVSQMHWDAIVALSEQPGPPVRRTTRTS